MQISNLKKKEDDVFDNLIKNLTDLWKETKNIKIKLVENNNEVFSEILPQIRQENSESSDINIFNKKNMNNI